MATRCTGHDAPGDQSVRVPGRGSAVFQDQRREASGESEQGVVLRLRPTLAKPTLTDLGHPYLTDFGQTDFGQPLLAEFGQTDFGQNWCCSLLASFFQKKNDKMKKKQSMEEQTPELWGPEGWGPEVWGAQKFRAFFPSPATVSFFFVSLWVSSRGILVVFEAPEPSIVHVWSSRAVV